MDGYNNVLEHIKYTHKRAAAGAFAKYAAAKYKNCSAVLEDTATYGFRTQLALEGYLLKRSPYLNAVEECWRQRKPVLLVSECYRTFADLCNVVITYYRTVRFKLGIFKVTALCMN